MVTNAQYTEFLNAVAASDPHGLWNSNMGSSVHGGISRSGSDGSYTYSVRTATSGYNNGHSMGNMPVTYVSFWDAARFTNWLTTGDTETGVYNLGNVTNPTNNTITRNSMAWHNGGYAIASQDEWFKAAYYDPISESYSLYATQSDIVPTRTTPNNTDSNSANYGDITLTVTSVGSYSLASSFYGTFDHSGLLREWTDTIFDENRRVTRGGDWNDNETRLRSSWSASTTVTTESAFWGFRVVTIPEPSTIILVALTGLSLGITPLYRRLRRSRKHS